jgi:DNA-binding ferritin-like protein
MKELITSFIGVTKANLTWFHAAHHLTKGSGFAGDHVTLFGEIYQEILEIFDELVEKSIALCDDESVASPQVLCHLSSTVLHQYPDPSNKSGDQIAVFALELARQYINTIEEVYQILDSNNFLSLGMDDFLSSTAGKYEKYVYLLGQRVKRGH